MVQPQFEILPESEEAEGDSLEVGRVVPIYEARGKLGPRVLRRLTAAALASLNGDIPDRLPESVRRKNQLSDRPTALRETHFPPKGQSLEGLARFRTPPQM